MSTPTCFDWPVSKRWHQTVSNRIPWKISICWMKSLIDEADRWSQRPQLGALSNRAFVGDWIRTLEIQLALRWSDGRFWLPSTRHRHPKNVHATSPERWEKFDHAVCLAISLLAGSHAAVLRKSFDLFDYRMYFYSAGGITSSIFIRSIKDNPFVEHITDRPIFQPIFCFSCFILTVKRASVMRPYGFLI